MTSEDLEDLEVYFVIIANKKEILLKENGNEIQVKGHNLEEYLNCLAKYYLKD